MRLKQYIDQINRDHLEGALSFSNVAPKRQLTTTSQGRASLPFWYGIKPIRFIWRGSWADPEILYNRMVVNATIIEESMFQNYLEYCSEAGSESSDSGFAQFMKNNKAEIVELIYLAHNSEKNN